jgi:hypothetical protein
MNIEALKTLAIAQQASAIKTLEWLTRCSLVGVSQEDAILHDKVVCKLATTTWFSNSFVCDTGKEYLLKRASSGLPAIPQDIQAWADELWDEVTSDKFLRQNGLPTLAMARPEQKLTWDKEARMLWEKLAGDHVCS